MGERKTMGKRVGEGGQARKKETCVLTREPLELPSAWGSNVKFALPESGENPEPQQPQLLPGLQSKQLPARFLLQGALLAFLVYESPRRLSVSGSRAGSWEAGLHTVFCFSLPVRLGQNACSLALGLSFPFFKMGLGPVELGAWDSFVWVNVEQDLSSSPASPRLFLGSALSDARVSDGSGHRP